MTQPSRRGRALLIVGVLLVGGAAGLAIANLPRPKAVVTSADTSRTLTTAEGQSFVMWHVPPGEPTPDDLRRFAREEPRDLRALTTCLSAAGLTPSIRRHAVYGYDELYGRVAIETPAGDYEIGIFPKRGLAHGWAYAESTAPSTVAVHPSQDGRVALVATALNGGSATQPGSESHDYYVERTAIARCAFSIPAANGRHVIYPF
jgi:hypothetical protein